MTTPINRLKKIAVTTGDINGIGLEVAVKSLVQLKPDLHKNKFLFFLFRDVGQEKSQAALFKKLDAHYVRFTFFSLTSALAFLSELKNLTGLPKNLIVDLALTSSPAEWVLISALACKSKALTSMVTGPISKKVTQALKQKPLGHTGIFKTIFPEKELHMAFVGNQFNVLLATDHIALNKVEASLLRGRFKSALACSLQLKSLLKSNKKIGVLGLNPHSGEGGLIGQAEKRLFKNLDSRQFAGPLVPDAAFLKKNLNSFSLFMCLYHDQGL
ncbi:MAG: 4-hydroxythreonine-4-phosphate dehydrogenase PdxA, partial [Pseudobdellovibrio sp.]